jgi:hypothetical protein
MGKRSVISGRHLAKSGKRRKPGNPISPWLLAGAGLSTVTVILATALTATSEEPVQTVNATGVEQVVVAPHRSPVVEVPARHPDWDDDETEPRRRASESPSATRRVTTPTPVPPRRSAVTTEPAPAPPAPIDYPRISAIWIDPPVKETETSEPTSETPVPPPSEEAEIEGPIVDEAQTAEPQATIGTECVAPEGNYNGVEPWVATIGAHVQEKFNVEAVSGKAGRGRTSDHPRGLALDFMTNTGNVDGDAIAEYLLVERAEDFNVKYVIWQQRIRYPGKDWVGMEDRGSDTENHRDHVHVSFGDQSGPVAPTC